MGPTSTRDAGIAAGPAPAGARPHARPRAAGGRAPGAFGAPGPQASPDAARRGPLARLRGILPTFVTPSFFGLALVHMWIYCSTHRPAATDDVSTMAVMYFVLSAALVAAFVALRPWRPGGGGATGAPPLARAIACPRRLATLDAACAACMGVSGAMLALPPSLPPVATVVVAAALGGLGVGWLYARWCALYARLDIHVAAPLAFLTMALGSLGKTVIDLLPAEPAALVLACLPALSIACARRASSRLAVAPGTPASPTGDVPAPVPVPACADAPGPAPAPAGAAGSAGARPAGAAPVPEPAVFYNSRTVGSLARIAAGVAVYSLTIGVVQSMLLELTTVGTTAVLIHHLGEVVIALAVVAWVSLARRGLNFCGTWRLISVLIATALIFEPFMGHVADSYLLSLVRTAQTFLIVFLFLALADIARHSRFHPFAVFAAGWTSYALPFAAGKVLGDCLTRSGASLPVVISCGVWALVVVMLFVLDQSSLGNRLIFAELNDVNDQDTLARRVAQTQREMGERDDAGRGGRDVLAASCDELAGACGLTPREREILELLARGRTKAHIAEAFFISENTVRNHVKHIYAKLGVHDRQELIDRVEAAGAQAAGVEGAAGGAAPVA
ncbi:MAG: LuxR C-terminal-related transcriptional regulator [Coriobacteriales bacterium]|jgi:DNA-binding CsgD family transcriptional regulator